MNSPKRTWPLSHPQKRIWLVEKLYGTSSVHHLMACSLKRGEIDPALLEAAIREFVGSNEGARLRLSENGPEARQYVSGSEPFAIPFLDFSREAEPGEALERWAQERSRTPIDPEGGYLFSFYLVRLEERKSGFLFLFHHLIADGWSLTRMMNAVWLGYEAKTRGVEPAAAKAAPSYLDYLEAERDYLASARFEKNRAFWLEEFRELPAGMRVRNSSETAGKRRSCLLPADLSASLKAFAASNECSVNALFVFAAFLYLHLTERRSDLIIGTPVLNRSGKREKETFGMYTSTMPVRCRIDGESAVSDLLRSVQDKLTRCYFHQKYPYDLLVRDLELKKKGYDGLFDLCVNYYNTAMISRVNGDLVETAELYGGSQHYALQIVVKDWREDGALLVSFDYKMSEYSEFEIESMAEKLLSLLQVLLTKPDARVADLEIVTPGEKRKLLDDWNRTEADYSRDACIHWLFERQAEREPDRIAVRLEDGSAMTYGELNAAANRLAWRLRERGVKRNVPVGIMASHSAELLAGLLAILKAGGAYVPIAPDYPAERARYILEDSQAALLLSNVPEALNVGFRGERLDLTAALAEPGRPDNPEPVNEPTDAAYIIYTSGSTGQPKGVSVGHRSLVNYIQWACKHYIADRDEVFALYSSISFDLTVTSLFAPLANGNSVQVYKDDGSDFVLHRIAKDNKAHIVKLTPAHLSLLRETDLSGSSIRRLIVGGEDLKTGLARAVHRGSDGRIALFNEYGPTEATVGCMIHRFDDALDVGASVPIGRPADNVRLYVLDDRLKPLPIGTIGELYVSGDGVALGYANRPDLTKARFLPDPFSPGLTMYRTGDLARYRPDGVLEYHGRVDHQVKIRGFRIEPGEIESRLTGHPDVSDCAVIDRAGPDGSPVLCAYYVGARQADEAEFRSFLASSLPSYMVPSFYVRLDALPLTPNGKVDRSALPDPIVAHSEESEGEETELRFADERERIVWETYREVLGVPRLGRRSSFYQLGGDSIKAIQIAAKLGDRGLRVKIKDILSLPYVSEVAATVTDEMEERAAEQGPAAGEVPATPIAEWFFEQRFKSPLYWNQSVLLKAKRELGAAEVRIALAAIVRHHDSLRLNLDPDTGRLFYNPRLLEADVPVEEIDLSGCGEEESARRIRENGERLKAGIGLEDGLPFAACLFRTGEGERLLLLTAHHLTVDAVSWRIVLDDLVRLIDRARLGEPLSLPGKTHSYQAWAAALRRYAERLPESEKAYWAELAAASADAGVLVPGAPPSPRLEQCDTAEAVLTEEETAALLGIANEAYLTETRDLLVLALALTIRSYTGNGKVLFELEGHGREELFEDIDVSRTVGWFTSLYPCLLRLTGDEPGALIREAKEQLRAVPSNGIGFGIAKHLGRSPLPEGNGGVRFNYVGEMDNGLGRPDFEFVLRDSGADRAPVNSLTCLLDVVALVSGKRLTIRAAYGRSYGRPVGLDSFANRMAGIIRSLLAHCAEAEKRQFTPSDFDAADLSQADLDLLIG